MRKISRGEQVRERSRLRRIVLTDGGSDKDPMSVWRNGGKRGWEVVGVFEEIAEGRSWGPRPYSREGGNDV